MSEKRIRVLFFLMTALIGCMMFVSPTKGQEPRSTVQVQPTNIPIPSATREQPIKYTEVAREEIKLSFADYLQELILYSVAARKAFIGETHYALSGYFNLISFALAWIVMLYSFLKTASESGWDANAAGRSMVRFMFCTFLIGAAPAIVHNLAEGGKSLAHDTNGGYYNIGGLVRYQDEKFTENYDKFVKNKFMVQMGGAEMPIEYNGKGDETFKTLAALYIGRMSPEQQKQVESEAWWMATSFTVLNGLRGAVYGVDLFLYWLEGFLLLVAVLVAPFMFAAGIDKELSNRMTKNFIWSLLVVTIIFPVVTQAARFIGFWFANLAIGGSNVNPYYTWDAQSMQIVAHGEPLYIIGVAIFCFIICIFLLLFSLGFSYKLTQGAVLEAIGSAVSSAFTSVASVGIQTAVGAKAAQLNTQAENEQIFSQYEQQVLSAGAGRDIAAMRAKTALEGAGIMTGGQFDAKMVENEAKRLAAQQNIDASYLNSRAGLSAEHFGSNQNALASMNKEIATLNSDEKRERASNFIDWAKENNAAKDANMVDRIEKSPQELETLADQMTQYFKGVPFVGDKEWMNAAMTTWAGKQIFGKYGESKDGKFELNGDGSPSSVQSPDREKGFGEVLSSQNITDAYKDKYGSYMGVLGDKGQELAKQFDTKKLDESNQYGMSPVPSGSFNTPPASPSLALQGMNKQQRENFKNLQSVMKQDPNFLPTLQRESQRRGISPDNMANMLGIESSFDPNANNGLGYIGLGQVGRSERQSIGRGWTGNDAVDMQRIKNMTPSQQLNELVFPFVDKKFGSATRNISMDKLYAGWGSGHFSNNPNYVHMVAGGKRSQAYYNNPGWDVNGDKKIQQWEFEPAAMKKLGAGQFFTVNEAYGVIKNADPAMAKNYAIKFGRDYKMQQSIRNNDFAYQNKEMNLGVSMDEKRGIAQNFAQNQIGINDRVNQIKMGGLDASTNMQRGAVETTYTADNKSAYIMRDTGYKQSEHNYQGEIKANNQNYDLQMKLAEIQKGAALDSARLRAESSLISTVGGSLSHAIGEAPERFNRY